MNHPRETVDAIRHFGSSFSTALKVLGEEIAKKEGSTELSIEHVWEAFNELTSNNAALVHRLSLGLEDWGDAERGQIARASE